MGEFSSAQLMITQSRQTSIVTQSNCHVCLSTRPLRHRSAHAPRPRIMQTTRRSAAAPLTGAKHQCMKLCTFVNPCSPSTAGHTRTLPPSWLMKTPLAMRFRAPPMLSAGAPGHLPNFYKASSYTLATLWPPAQNTSPLTGFSQGCALLRHNLLTCDRH